MSFLMKGQAKNWMGTCPPISDAPVRCSDAKIFLGTTFGGDKSDFFLSKTILPK